MVNSVVGVSKRIIQIHKDAGLFGNDVSAEVIYNAAPLPDYKAGGSAAIRYPVKVGFIGRVTEEKGVYNLARAMELLPKGHARLVIAGQMTDDEKRVICSLAPSVDIEFLGFVARDLFFSQVDMVAVPSIWEEPGSLVLGEARSAFKPVLGTTFGGIPEVIENGVTGWIAGSGPQDLATIICKITPKGLYEMSQKLRSDREFRDSGKVAEDYIKLYERLIPRNIEGPDEAETAMQEVRS